MRRFTSASIIARCNGAPADKLGPRISVLRGAAAGRGMAASRAPPSASLFSCALRSKYGIEAFNYKRTPVAEALGALAPEGVDIFFDNVGGATLDQALLHMRKYGTIVTCGAVAEYNAAEKLSCRTLALLSVRRTSFY